MEKQNLSQKQKILTKLNKAIKKVYYDYYSTKYTNISISVNSDFNIGSVSSISKLSTTKNSYVEEVALTVSFNVKIKSTQRDFVQSPVIILNFYRAYYQKDDEDVVSMFYPVFTPNQFILSVNLTYTILNIFALEFFEEGIDDIVVFKVQYIDTNEKDLIPEIKLVKSPNVDYVLYSDRARKIISWYINEYAG